MFKIKEKRLNILKKREILITAILVIIIIGLLLAVVISDNKLKATSANETKKLEINIQEDEQEYIDINQLEENLVVEESNNIIENTETGDKTNETNKNTTGSTPYYIKVNYGAQVVTIYKKDDKGNYTVPIKAMICSTGVATPTSGVYAIPARWRWLGLQGDVYGQYCTQIKGNILFHSVPYLERGNPASLEYWEYDKLGTYASAGCIRLTVADAIWIYNNCAKGTKVEFYSSSNPGPLGKPSAKKISNAEGNLKNWDPTDPDPNNPWKNYKQDENKNNNINNNVNSNTQTNEITNVIKNEIVNEMKNETVNKITENTINTTEILTNIIS